MDQIHGLIFNPHDLNTLVKAFSLAIEDRKLSNLAYKIASSGKLLSKNLLAFDCIADYGKLLENVLEFPSDAMLPLSVSHIKLNTWVWELFEEVKYITVSAQDDSFQNNHMVGRRSIVDFFEEQLQVQSTTQIANEYSDFPTQLDWDILTEMETLEDYERREREEVSCSSCFCNY